MSLTKVTYSMIKGATVNVADYGAVGDGVVDDTTAIQAAIDYAKSIGGATVFFPQGVYIASRIEIPRNVLLDGGQVMLTELKQKANSNQDFIVSEGFSGFTGTGVLYPNNPAVPGWFGLKDIRVNGNKANQTAGNGLSWYGFGQLMLGIVLVYDCYQDNIYTESSDTPPSFLAGGWESQEEGFFETVISRTAGRHCWLNRGPHNYNLQIYTCEIDRDATGYGFISERSSTYTGLSDRVGLMHVYTSGTNTTNRRGYYFGAGTRIDMLICDSVSAEFPSIVSGSPCEVDFISLNGIGKATNFDGITISGSNTVINSINGATDSAATGVTGLKITGSNNYIGHVFLFDNSAGAANKGIDVAGNANQVASANIRNFNGTGATGVKVVGGFHHLTGVIQSCTTAFDYTLSSGNNTIDLTIFLGAGQIPVTGNAPALTSDRFQIRYSGSSVGSNPRSVTTSGASANQVDMTSTAVQTITLPHNCPYTPVRQNVQLSFATTITDYAWDFPPQFDSADATNLVIKCKLSTASSTPVSRGDITARVNVGT